MEADRPDPVCSTVDCAAGRSSSRGAVRILSAGVRLTVLPGESIVDAVRRHGYRTRYSCRRGGCGVCKADLVEGHVHYRLPIAESVLSEADRDGGKCLPCRAEPVGDVVIRLSGRDQLRHILGTVHPASDATG
ncbi:2Fe-2S iron-sulfur cluster-binding protein [Streptomyces mirabilis]|uniref:2Fe-2S iron-sulfur cluster-binding protein n=1 Tax=Streptomyces mirabilis TaxID=68239 RepID=UPI00367BF0F5